MVRNDHTRYGILREEQYQELLEAQKEAYRARSQRAMADVQAGRVKRSTAQSIVTEFELED